MIDPWTSARIPSAIRNRRWWLLPLLVWSLAVGGSLYQHLKDLHGQSLQVAQEGARNLFNMVVLTRAWNASHGGVYVPVSDKAPPNPWLVHPRRDVTTTDGRQLTMINPAYMTRQIAELASTRQGAVFHITSLKPIRPQNAPDDWERGALAAFEKGAGEVSELLREGQGGARLRYMAPLRVTPPCLACHAVQGYKNGDVRGGISVSVPFEPVLAASRHAREQTWINHVGVFLAVLLAGWGLLELLRRRWHDLADNLTALETARNTLVASNAELARARDQAESASRSKSAFLAAMSHELRTPLNGILGFAHLLQRGALPDKAMEQAGRIQQQGERLLDLVSEVMDFSRLETLEPPAQRGELDLAASLSALAAELRRKALAKGLDVHLDLAADLPHRVAGELEFLQGALRPLLDNAVKFTDQGGVAMSARAEQTPESLCTLHVTVSDTGAGIAPADRDKLFQPFRQVDDSLSRRHGGLGLGLAMASRYAALLGAVLDFDSAAGAGSRFHLRWITRIPVADGEPAMAALVDAAPLLQELETLLDEDDLGAAALLNQALPVLAREGAPAAELESLRRDVENFDYPAALVRLRGLGIRRLHG